MVSNGQSRLSHGRFSAPWLVIAHNPQDLNLLCMFTARVLCGPLGVFSFFGVELGTAVREVFQLNQKTSNMELESENVAAPS